MAVHQILSRENSEISVLRTISKSTAQKTSRARPGIHEYETVLRGNGNPAANI
jgi:hypothetical protein